MKDLWGMRKYKGDSGEVNKIGKRLAIALVGRERKAKTHEKLMYLSAGAHQNPSK